MPNSQIANAKQFFQMFPQGINGATGISAGTSRRSPTGYSLHIDFKSFTSASNWAHWFATQGYRAEIKRFKQQWYISLPADGIGA